MELLFLLVERGGELVTRDEIVTLIWGKDVLDVSPPEAGPAKAEEQASEAGNLVGKKVSHYRVLQVLGGGGTGVVYKAAIKFLPAAQAAGTRFGTESEAVVRVW
jgi:hypothetical protein